MRFIFIFLLSALLTQECFSQIQKGFYDFEWKENTGELILDVPVERVGEKFLYTNALTAGVGSNDIGLDRGQLGDERVVSFYKSGNKLLLIEDNLKYRAISDDEEERRAVEEAFAKSVLWGFKIKAENSKVIQIALNDFLLRDAHGVVERLAENKQGQYKVDKGKSAIYKEGLFNFPYNSEFEAIITYSGIAKGDYIKSVVPTANLVSVRQHHSFVKLPDDNYQPRMFKPECGYFPLSYYDYATDIDKDIIKRFIYRHRLEKKYPNQAISEAKEPIVYYLDRGCPEPIRSALIEGAQWWNEAFEAAGFKDAFQVKILPEGAHPLDVRYNMIQWVHRSTRGWSYGGSVSDPRTGEILKGHVSLGSLRVRQDYLIAQGIVSSFDEGKDDPRMLEMALARLRQLSAHEVGHTIGLAHNFASSYNDRASVMDYPHPYIELNDNGRLDFTNAYDVGIGEWDKRAVIYGYSVTTEDENDYLNSLITKNRNDGFKYITDQDARPIGGLHPHAHLWDNGKDVIGELSRITKLRHHVLNNLDEGAIPLGTPYSEIEKVIVPAYLMHRYQVEAVAKIIGGVDFNYDTKSSIKNGSFKMISHGKQEKGLQSLLNTLDISFLKMPESLVQLVPPPAFGYQRNRESLKGYTGSLLDPLAAAEASANHTITFLLNKERLARIYNQSSPSWNLEYYLETILDHLKLQTKTDLKYGLMLEKLFFIHLLKVANDNDANKQVSALTKVVLMQFHNIEDLTKMSDYEGMQHKAHQVYLSGLLKTFMEDASKLTLPKLIVMPPGSPIGCSH